MKDYADSPLIRFFLVVVMIISLSGCSDEKTATATLAPKPQMLVYCGITMVNPIKEIAALMEKELDVEIIITQGGSEDLYQSLRIAAKGDLYLPGSASYRQRHQHEGLLGDYIHVGYNKAALFVAKGNPLNLTNDIHQLHDENLRVMVGDPDSGSIGRETFKILEKAGIAEKVRHNAIHLSTDSRALNYSIKENKADLILNWRATAFFKDNREFIDVIDLPDDIAVPKKLELNMLTFSQYPEKARRFMAFSASEQGQAIFRKHGFIDKDSLKDI